MGGQGGGGGGSRQQGDGLPRDTRAFLAAWGRAARYLCRISALPGGGWGDIS